MQGRPQVPTLERLRFQTADEIAHVTDDQVEFGDALLELLCGRGILLRQPSTLTQTQANRVNRLNDPVVKIASDANPFLEGTPQLLFTLAQGFFGQAPFRDVPGDTQDLNRPAREALSSDIDAEHHTLAGFCGGAHFDVTAVRSLLEPFDDMEIGGPIFGHDELSELQSAGFFARVTENLFARAIQRSQLAGEIVGKQDVVCVLEEILVVVMQCLFALPDRFQLPA